MYWLVLPLVAAFYDWKTGEIPDWITVPGVIIAFFYGLAEDPSILPGFLSFAFTGYLLYRYGLVGGGDVLLILSTLPFLSSLPGGVLLPFIVLLGGFITTTTLYGIYYNRNRPILILPIFFLPLFLLPLYGTLLFALVEKDRFVKEVDVEELQKEDILAEMPPGFNKRVIEEGDKEKLRALGYEKVKILVNLPKMGPGLFITYVALLFWKEIVKFSLLIPVQALFLLF